MSVRWRPHLHGPGSASGPPASDNRPWWAKPRRSVVRTRAVGAMAAALGHSYWAVRCDARIEGVAAAASAIQEASDEHAVLEAVAAAVNLHGLNAQLALLDGSGEMVTVRRMVVPWAAQAQMELIHRGPMVGMRLAAGPGTSPWAMVREGARMDTAEALSWVVRPAPDVENAERDAIGVLIGLGEAYLTPIANGRNVFGALTIWAPTLQRHDRAAATILARLAGDALAAQQVHAAVPPDGRLVAPRQASEAKVGLAA